MEDTFDVVTACQCFQYFDYEKLFPKLSRMLKKNGKFAIMYMTWLLDDDPIAEKSEELVLKYNPGWIGAREQKHHIDLPKLTRSTSPRTRHILEKRIP